MTATYKDLDGVINWTRDYFKSAKVEKAVIGLSGGIDSAVAASICCRALGSENVIGAILPCYSQQRDENYAYNLVSSLSLNDISLELESTFDIFWKSYRDSVHYDAYIPDTYSALVPANIKARLRMVSLYALAGHIGGLVVGTTNQSEFRIGYATKFGDGASDLEPLQDFYKGEIYELAILLDDIPKEIINAAPSADLWPGQTDEGELGMTYAYIDDYLKTRSKQCADPLASSPFPYDARIEKLITDSEHKNLHLPYYKRGEC